MIQELGLFLKILIDKLRPIRDVMEQYSQTAILHNVENFNACGISINSDIDERIPVILRVTTGGVQKLFKITMWE